MQGIFDEKDLPYFARQLAKQISRPILITDESQRVLVSHDHLGVLSSGKVDITLLEGDEVEIHDLIAAKDLPLGRTWWHTQDIHMEGYQLPLASRGQVWGYCFVVSDKDLTDEERECLFEAAFVILLTLGNLNRSREEQEHQKAELIRDMLYNNYDSQAEIVAKARNWGWELSGAWALVVGEVDKEMVKKAKELVPLQLINKRRPIVTILNGQLLLLIPLPYGDRSKHREIVNSFVDCFTTLLRNKGFTKIEFGVGSFSDSVDYLHKVYQEAKMALELGRNFELGYPCYFTEMGVLKFVFAQPAFELQEFTQRVLGDLFAYDRENETDLVHTLSTYFTARIQIPECARLLFVHENTLRNRLKKIEQLTGFDLRRIDHLVNFYVASQIAKIGKQ